ncbi:MAG: hypothetical protein OES38_14675 [Gammaproteobacteria bacterium]|nr:hypothetical protein [Gammaproteobacteria bacterium]
MRFTVLIALLALAGCEFIGGAETLVRGENNRLFMDPTIDEVAEQLAGFETTPEVTDAELAAIYERIREQALAGDLRSSLVMLNIAASQRKAAEEAAQEAEAAAEADG